jgi:hypothetical protein
VELAPGADPGRGGDERQARHDHAERGPEARGAGEVGEARGPEDGGADRVREARGARVLERPLAEAGLHELEVQDARQTEAPAKNEPDRELGGQHRQQGPGPGREGGERAEADDGLVEARRAGVDDVEVAVGIGGARAGRPGGRVVKHTGCDV